MKTESVQYVLDGREAVLSLPFRSEVVQFRLDADDLALIQRECATVNVFEPKPGLRYIRVYTRDRHQISLHRYLLGLKTGDSRIGDHKNGDTMDYRRENLRAIEFWGNCLNRRSATRESTSQIRCVYRNKHKWVAMVCHTVLGRFADIRDAAEAVWLRLLQLDPVAAANYLRSLPNA